MTTNTKTPIKVCMTVLASAPQRNSRRGLTVAVFLIVAQIASGSGCSSSGRTTKADQRKSRRQAAERQIEELAKKYGANTNWVDSIKSNGKGFDVFSFQRQEVFDPLIGRPILAVVTILDVCRAKGAYCLICRFSQDHPRTSDWEDTYFVLDLPREKALQVAAIRDARILENFVLIAVLSTAEVKFNRELSAELSSEPDDDGVMRVPEASVGELSPEVWVKGKCLEVEHVPNY
jgi:hypothetical protein